MSVRRALFVEIGPLLELRYTGIANLTAAVASFWLENDDDLDVYFFNEHLVIDPGEIRRAVELRCGVILRCQVSSGEAIIGYVEEIASRYDLRSALFCNVKTVCDLFDREYQIICDLTVLLTPEFHHTDTINYHGLTLKRDLSSNQKTYCISECTKDDLETYCGGLSQATEVHYPGVKRDLDEATPIGINFEKCGKYIIVAGTIEPRKNTELVLELVQNNPSIMQKYRIVFIGRTGWLTDFKVTLNKLGLLGAFDNKKIVWLDFVDDIERDLLYKGAALSIYASLYEGFGLPVAEAMAFGCPVLLSFASSLPEVGGSAAIYFDPLSLDSLALAFSQYEKSDLPKLKQACVEQASKFSWERFNDGIYKSVVADMELKLDAAS